MATGEDGSIGGSDADMAQEAMALSVEHDALPPLVPEGGLFEGQIAVVGETRIDGAVQGSLRGPGSLVLGPEANVEGVIDCERVESRGRVMGPVSARSGVRLAAGCQLEGDVDAPVLEVADDAIWTGRAKIGR